MEAGWDRTCTTLVTPGLDACPKLTKEAKLQGAFLLGLYLCWEKTLLRFRFRSAGVEWDFFVASKRKGVSLTLRRSRGDPLPALGLLPSQDPGESANSWPDSWLSLHRCCSCHPMLCSP